MLRLVYRRLLHAIDNHGLRGAIVRAISRPHAHVGTVIEAAGPEVATHPFDVRYNTDTSGYLPGETLATGSASDLYNTAYYAISPSTLTQANAALPIDPAGYTFVDLGCGKGRALLVAAHASFGQVIGVELSPALATTAQSNARGYDNVQICIGDAATVTYPNGPLLVFWYHPFLAPLLRKVLRNLALQAKGREVYLLCANPMYDNVYARFPQLRQQWRYTFALSTEDAAADRHGVTAEPYVLWHLSLD